MMLCNMLLILVFTVFIYDFCFQISGRDHSMAFACGRTKRHACKCRKSHDVRFLLFAIWFWPVEFMLNVFLCFFFSILLYQAKGIRGQTHDLTNSRATCIFATSNMNECAVVTANQKLKREKCGIWAIQCCRKRQNRTQQHSESIELFVNNKARSPQQPRLIDKTGNSIEMVCVVDFRWNKF